MFASSNPFSRSPRQALSGLYRQVGVESAVSGGASPHRLVAMLFDGAIEAIVQARGALRERNIELKGRAIGRAARIVDEGLKAGLNLEAGGELAANLRDVYIYVTTRLTLANVRNDDAMLEECQRLMEPLRDAWASIGTRVQS
jgi:flagellar protein FliS